MKIFDFSSNFICDFVYLHSGVSNKVHIICFTFCIAATPLQGFFSGKVVNQTAESSFCDADLKTTAKDYREFYAESFKSMLYVSENANFAFNFAVLKILLTKIVF